LEGDKHIIGFNPFIDAIPHSPRRCRIDNLQGAAPTRNGDTSLQKSEVSVAAFPADSEGGGCYHRLAPADPFDEGHGLDIVAAVMLLGRRHNRDIGYQPAVLWRAFFDRAGFNLAELIGHPDLHHHPGRPPPVRCWADTSRAGSSFGTSAGRWQAEKWQQRDDGTQNRGTLGATENNDSRSKKMSFAFYRVNIYGHKQSNQPNMAGCKSGSVARPSAC